MERSRKVLKVVGDHEHPQISLFRVEAFLLVPLWGYFLISNYFFSLRVEAFLLVPLSGSFLLNNSIFALSVRLSGCLAGWGWMNGWLSSRFK